jgi:hypothetical protein
MRAIRLQIAKCKMQIENCGSDFVTILHFAIVTLQFAILFFILPIPSSSSLSAFLHSSAEELSEAARLAAEVGGAEVDGRPLGRERFGQRGVGVDRNADEGVQAIAKRKDFFGRGWRAIAYQMKREHQRALRGATKAILPILHRGEVFGRRPVAPILWMFRARREAAALHVDQPRGGRAPRLITRNGNKVVETFERALGRERAALFVHRDVRKAFLTEVRFKRGFVMVMAFGHRPGPRKLKDED